MQIKILALDRAKITSLVYFTALLGVSIIAPLFHFQPITGPIVNGCLFIATALLGAQAGIMLGLLPSIIALSVGALPIALAPMVPFIMASNAILVVVFSKLKGTECLTGCKALGALLSAVVWASILKFLFLYSTSFVVLRLISQKPIAQKAAQMMSLPQLITALIGGIIACFVIKIYEIKNKKTN